MSMAQFRSLLWSLNIPRVSASPCMDPSIAAALRPRLSNELQAHLWHCYSQLKRSHAAGVAELSAADFYVLRQILLRHADATSARWVLAVVRDMKKCGHRPDVVVERDTMNAHRALEDYHGVLAIFDRLLVEYGAALPVSIWNLALLAHLRLGHYDEADRFIECMAEHGRLPDMQTYNRLMHRYAKLGNLARVRALLERARSMKLELTDYTYATYIHASVNAVDLRGATRIFYNYLCHMRRKRLPANPVPFGALLQGLIRQQWYLAADKLWATTRLYRMRYSVKLYNIRLTGLVAMGDMHRAEALFAVMRGMGDTGTDAITYLEMIRGYTRYGQREKARDLLLSTEVWRLTVRERTVHPGFSHLIAAIIDAGDEAMLKELHVAMRSLPSDIMPDTATLNTLCARQRRPIDLTEARAILDRFRRMHATPTVATYGVLLTRLLQSGHPLDAVALYETDWKQARLTPNQHIYSSLFHAAYLLRDGALAYTLWQSLQASCQKPNWIVVSAALRVFAAIGDSTTCLRIYRTYRQQEGVPPSATVVETLLKGLVRDGAFAEAIAVWEELMHYYPKSNALS
ncbi:hypothetical protein SYNPS1DRAFT_20815 [Syncephalis pseudoplumigaleata]|uniref:Pentacotripeptide-repeat region of PRORP domain-containing protein n=1 Tax=Syncephalis pseudoplumigaleata TaxID=1712513 RepID=A0A4V1J291_9FUNG|nr:hypothetical protein SYNPS1DRAFT_20815 [Syncephalis pseudoplumigaleata]|eukprot:RKP27739.1 hypothetical protein SYNPS1DRAFT_20815 [Syncephalis pseudoplumigaleata]